MAGRLNFRRGILEIVFTVQEEPGLVGAKKNSFRSFNVAENHPAISTAMRAAHSIGVEPHLWASGGGLDAYIFNGRDLPCVALGLGIENPHSPQEYVPASQLEDGVHLLFAILQEAAGTP